tara:strand:- start:1295 stop:1660 length:366 start_codon:yes stop_codon:yes gene_type:complete
MSMNNIILIKDVSHYTFDFKSLFEKNNSIIWKNCHDISINIDNKINKMIFNNCYNITVICNHLVSGIEYFKCKNIIQNISDNNQINCLDLYHTDISINIHDIKKIPVIIKEKSLVYINKID